MNLPLIEGEDVSAGKMCAREIGLECPQVVLELECIEVYSLIPMMDLLREPEVTAQGQ